ncbi:ISAzo13-like element transposase-related protein [Catenuloplanes indicus]|uniref:Transposase n=1 Tax=Catenuloplanes indicus TaxID=137267 RepID=A0AAE3W9B0_9ACTN|nr:hypothetical protein [Catenuloplanes indicus]MDQ0371039.1 hypothetical protein [Catenuloplanes indicus]
MGVSEKSAEDPLAGMFAELAGHLDERQRRLVMGAQARRLGRGGIAVVARAAGVNRKTVARGVDELDGRAEPPGRVRAPGAGRRTAVEADDGLERALWDLMEPRDAARSPLRWTTRSVRWLADALRAAGHPVSTWTVRRLLEAGGFRRPAAPSRGGHGGWPDGERERRFRRLDDQAAAFVDAGEPVVSLVAWRGGIPEATGADGATVGLADRRHRVPVGGDRETAGFAVSSLRRWWAMAGAGEHPGARRMLVVADSVHATEHRHPWLRTGLAGFGGEAGLAVVAGDLPPGISRWNQLAHRMSDQVVLRPRGGPTAGYLVAIGVVGPE